jgi:ABC-type glycerol-3-phosphate transport system substrate-binding protein
MWNSDATPAALTWYKEVLIPAFEKTHPGVTVNVTKTPWGVNLTSKIVTSFAAGVGPDIMYGGAEFVDDWVSNGFVSPITEQVKGWRDFTDILPPTMGAVTYKGNVYGVPVQLDYRNPMINRQVFLTSGINPDSPPNTWDEFIMTAKKLTRRTDKLEVSGMQIGTTYQEFNQMVWQNGGQILNEAKTAPAFNEPAGLDALAYWSNAIKEVNAKEISGNANFVNGKLAMFYSSSTGLINAIVDAGLPVDEVLSIIPPLKQKVAATAIHTQWLAIGNQSKHADLAWDFIKLHLSMDYYPAYIAAQRGIPSRLATLRTDYVKTSPWLVKMLNYASQFGRATWTARDFPALRDSIAPELTKVYNGTASPQEALENAARSWREILAPK